MKRQSKLLGLLGILLISFWLSSCCNSFYPSLKPATIVKNENLDSFTYLYITSTNSLTSSSGQLIGGQIYSYTKSVNPSDLIKGILSKRGLVILPELKPELTKETLIVNYGESGRRKTGIFGGYTIEVTIQFISAKTNSIICSCTAEGQGSTEADDIRQAITRCLEGFVEKEN